MTIRLSETQKRGTVVQSVRRETRREKPILAGKPDKKGRETGKKGRETGKRGRKEGERDPKEEAKGRKEAKDLKEQEKDPLRQNGVHMKKEVNRVNDTMRIVATQGKDPSVKNAPRVNGTAKEGRSREVSDPIKSVNKKDAHSMPEARTVVASPGKITNRATLKKERPAV